MKTAVSSGAGGRTGGLGAVGRPKQREVREQQERLGIARDTWDRLYCGVKSKGRVEWCGVACKLWIRSEQPEGFLFYLYEFCCFVSVSVFPF